jgi:phthalate 4,5-cis-dihydrodiol dehydrogenase
MVGIETDYTVSSLAPRTMKLGIAGLGVGANTVIDQGEQADFVELVAAADVRPQALDAFRQRFGARGYDSVEGLARDPNVEVVWVSTPNPLHCEHTVTLLEHGKHVIVEKPMATSLEEAARMVEAAERSGRKLMCGHTASLLPGFRAMRRVISSGRLGNVEAINCWSYVDWIFRPRMPDEINLAKGGGQPFRQGPHQFDCVRLLGGGMVKSIRGSVREWMSFRPTPSYYTAFLEFEDGMPATIVKDGTGYFLTTELVPWAAPPTRSDRGAELRKALREGRAADEAASKEARRFGGNGQRAGGEGEGWGNSGFQQDAGLVVVSCERGALRQSYGGVFVYDDDGVHDEPVGEIEGGRRTELQEMHEAIVQDRPVPHDGRWGMATLECILAMLQSSKEGREILLSHQCPAWE